MRRLSRDAQLAGEIRNRWTSWRALDCAQQRPACVVSIDEGAFRWRAAAMRSAVATISWISSVACHCHAGSLLRRRGPSARTIDLDRAISIRRVDPSVRRWKRAPRRSATTSAKPRGIAPYSAARPLFGGLDGRRIARIQVTASVSRSKPRRPRRRAMRLPPARRTMAGATVASLSAERRRLETPFPAAARPTNTRFAFVSSSSRATVGADAPPLRTRQA